MIQRDFAVQLGEGYNIPVPLSPNRQRGRGVWRGMVFGVLSLKQGKHAFLKARLFLLK